MDWRQIVRTLSGRSLAASEPAAEEPILRYEIVFCIFMAASVILCRENPGIVFPEILYLFLALLLLNWAAVTALRRRSGLGWVSGLIIAGNMAAITAIMEYSGAGDSNLWVLFLLPIYTACMMLSSREVLLVTAGTIAFNTVYSVFSGWEVPEALVLSLAIKSAVLIFAAASTWRIAQRDRAARGRVLTQVAELERLEERLREESLRARKADRAVEAGLMMAGVAHDLSNTLWVIESTAELMMGQAGAESEAGPELRRILRSVELGRGILSHLLGHIRQEKIALEPVDLNALIENVLNVVSVPLQQSNVRVSRELSRELPRVAGSRAHLERLFLNLVTNAKDAMARGGSLRVRTEPARGAQTGHSAVRAIVEDDGPGLPPEVKAKLFKPFVTTKAPGAGTGLGIFICGEIAHQHHGSIEAEVPPSGGTRFVVTLPSARKT